MFTIGIPGSGIQPRGTAAAEGEREGGTPAQYWGTCCRGNTHAPPHEETRQSVENL